MRRAGILVLVFAAAAAFAGDPNQKRGFNDQVYQIGELDHVNLFNGNVVIRIPIGPSYQVGPTLQYRLMLTYNSKIWDYRFYEYDCADPVVGCQIRYGVPEKYSNAGFGWALSLGRLIPPNNVEPLHGWIYIGPDGGEHEFHEILDPDPSTNPPAMSVVQARTTDSSYLQLRRYSEDQQEVQFPDGHVKRFDAAGRLTEMRDRHGNWVRVTYSATQWVITDGFGSGTGSMVARTHYVNLTDKSATFTDPNFKFVVSSVNLAAFDQTPDNPNDAEDRANFTFSYEDRWVGRGGGGERDDTLPSYCITAPFLESISLPDGTVYDPAYKFVAGGLSGTPSACIPASGDRYSVLDADYGVIQSLKLPTGGSIEWVHGHYPMNLQECVNGVGYASGYVGVRSRTFLGKTGEELTRWDYTPALVSAGGTMNETCEGQWGLIPRPAEEFVNKVEIWSGAAGSGGRKLQTRNFFSAFPQGGFVTNGSSPNGFRREDYGLPFTRLNPIGSGDGLRLLSSEVSDCTTTCNVLQRSYVLYEGDGQNLATKRHRVKAERTVHSQDTGCGGAPCYTDAQRSEWDGFGHYRRTVTTSNVPGSVERTSFVNYTPDAAEWLLEKYTDSWVKEGSGATVRKSVAVFDDTLGVLKSVRTLRATGSDPNTLATSPNDLLTARCRDGSVAGTRGFVTSERYFGGDLAAIPAGEPCIATRGAGHYFMNHGYTFSGAKLTGHTAKYDGPPELVTDEDFDTQTGLVKTSRDSAGVKTEYRFDTSGRLTLAKPEGQASATYEYQVSSDPAAVVVRQCAIGLNTCSTDSLNESRYYFDPLGRLVQERRRIPGSQWSATWTTLDAAGRPVTKSVPVASSSGAAGPMPAGTQITSLQYDVLGRVTRETRPDTSYSTIVYSGARQIDRLVADPGQAEQLRSKELYDGGGRLVSVTQPSGPTSASAAIGANVVTEYSYDPAGRLTNVRMVGSETSQTRVFDYDGRGFLRWESHPEGGMSSYTYDAKGNVLTKHQGAANTLFDLTYSYDSAGRPLTISGRNPLFDPADPNDPDNPAFRVMKVFGYGTANATNDKRKGKLVTAARYNYDPSGQDDTYKVTETYRYGDGAGRMTGRTTMITKGTGANEAWWDTYREIDMEMSYDALDLPSLVEYPMCVGCGSPANPLRNQSYTYDHGRLKTMSGFLTNTTYWPNGMWNVMSRSNGMSDTQAVDPSGMARPASFTFTPSDACNPPVITGDPVGGTISQSTPSINLTVTVSGSGPFTYQWWSSDSSSPIGYGSSYAASPSSTTEYWVIVTNECKSTTSVAATVTVGACVAPDGQASSTAHANGTYTLEAVGSGTEPRTYTWRRSSDQALVGTGRKVTVGPLASTTTYTVTFANCSATTATANVTVTIPVTVAPAGLTAVRTATTQVTVNWSGVAGGGPYQVHRRSGATWELLVEVTGTSYVDNGVQAGKSYAYRVNKTGSKGVSSAAIVTTTTFTPVVAGNLVTASSLDPMLAAVNSVRAAAGWPVVPWTNILSSSDPSPTPSVKILTAHIATCRARMNEALQALGVPIAGFTDPDVHGVPVKAVHINEIMGRAN